jgi:hypothetical protein
MKKERSLTNSFFEDQSINPTLAYELANAAFQEYKNLRSVLEKGQSINMTCSAGGQVYDVSNIGVDDNFLRIQCFSDEGSICFIAPVEQIVFTITVSDKISVKPPREIGFRAIEEEYKKASHKK